MFYCMLRALDEQGLAGKVRFVGFDSSDSMLADLRDGTLHAIVVQDPFRIGYEAVKTLVDKLNGKTPPVIDSFTGVQRFFLGFGQIWRQLIRDEALRNQVVSDPHSPGQFRVKGVVSNSAEFQKAFGCKAGDPMVRETAKRARIW